MIGADSAAPLAVQASAETLREVLLGKTAPAAVKMLLGMAAVVPEVVTTHAVPFMDMQTISPVAILGRALEAWREGAGQMRVSPWLSCRGASGVRLLTVSKAQGKTAAVPLLSAPSGTTRVA